MSKGAKPLIMLSPLTGQWFIVTKYRSTEGTAIFGPRAGERGRYIVAEQKWDVTDRMAEIFKWHDATTRKPKPARRPRRGAKVTNHQ